jgi:hypothetical protein
MPSHEKYISTKKENIRRHKENNILNESVVYHTKLKKYNIISFGNFQFLLLGK